jgi:hypothetical protein
LELEAEPGAILSYPATMKSPAVALEVHIGSLEACHKVVGALPGSAKPQRLTLEHWRPTQKWLEIIDIRSGATEANPGALNVHHGAFKAHPRNMELSHRHVAAYGTLES